MISLISDVNAIIQPYEMTDGTIYKSTTGFAKATNRKIFDKCSKETAIKHIRKMKGTNKHWTYNATYLDIVIEWKSLLGNVCSAYHQGPFNQYNQQTRKQHLNDILNGKTSMDLIRIYGNDNDNDF